MENLNVLRKTQKNTKFFCSNKIKVTKIDKDGNESVVTISYKIKSIDSAKFLPSSLSSLGDSPIVESLMKD